MYLLETICHAHVDKLKLLDIIRIKSTAWNYSLEEQLHWINKNITPSDIHCLLEVNSINVAYLNLVDIELDFNGSMYKGYGVGNVCSSEKGKGYGSVLVEKVNLYIKRHARIGMLFCKSDLLNFYSRLGWIEVPKNHLQIAMSLNGINVMAYNIPSSVSCLKYSGPLF